LDEKFIRLWRKSDHPDQPSPKTTVGTAKLNCLNIMIKPIGDWKEIFAPTKNSRYVNDHTIFADKSGQYRLIGTTSSKNYAVHRERFFVEAIADKIDGTYIENKITFKYDPHPGVKISPFVFFSDKDKKFHLFFGPWKISHYISDDGENWTYAGVAVKTIWPLTRDPYIFHYNDKYLMYLTGSNNRIIVFESLDLSKWKYIGAALKLGLGSPVSPNSACESPSVLEHNGSFYLFTTIVPGLVGVKKHYNDTFVFRSSNPYDFGKFNGKNGQNAKLIGQLETHAPEIFIQDDKIFYTTCGWSKMPRPEGVDCDGVCIRELEID